MGICEDVKGGRQIGVARETLTPSPVQPQTDLARPAGCVRLCLSGCWSPPCLGRAPRECSLLVPRCVPSQECHVCFLLHDSPGAWVEACVWLQVALDSPGSPFCVLWRKGSGTGLWVTQPLFSLDSSHCPFICSFIPWISVGCLADTDLRSSPSPQAGLDLTCFEGQIRRICQKLRHLWEVAS